MTPVYVVMCFRVNRARELYRAGLIPVHEFRQRLRDLGFDRISIDIEVMTGEPPVLHMIRRRDHAER